MGIAAWMKMAMTVAVALLPGGFLCLFVWALWRAFSLRCREAGLAEGERPSAWRMLMAIRLRDVAREARQFSGLPTASTGH